jgi:tetratricopeptide (TPR) repeat protein
MAQSAVIIRSRKKKALACLQSNRLQEAKAIYSEICRSTSRDAEAWFMLGAVNGQLGLFDEAVVCCRRAVEVNPGYADAYYNLGQAHMH